MARTARSMAYLGPAGTYGEQAANHFARRLGGEISLRPCETIPAVYEAAKVTDYAVLPIENTLQGAVLDTLDALLSPLADPSFPSQSFLYPNPESTYLDSTFDAAPAPRANCPPNCPPNCPLPSSSSSRTSSSTSPPSYSTPTSSAPSAFSSQEAPPYPRIVADTTLPISHQLVGLRGASIADITYVRSHEQALGQCSAWLDEYLPNAERVKWPSTAGALTSVLAQGDRRGAAICSRAAVEREGNRVGVLAEGVQGVKNNYTRFVLLAREAPPPASASGHRIAFYALRDIDAVGGVSHFGTVVSIHQRPAPPGAVTGVAFPRYALVEVRLNALDMDVDGAVCIGAFCTEDIPAPK